MRSVISYWRDQGIKIIMFLEDGLGGACNYVSAQTVSTRMKADLARLGFLNAEEK